MVEIYIFDRNDMLSLQTSRRDKGNSLLPTNHSVKTKSFHLGNEQYLPRIATNQSVKTKSFHLGKEQYLPRIERNTVAYADCHRATRWSVRIRYVFCSAHTGACRTDPSQSGIWHFNITSIRWREMGSMLQTDTSNSSEEQAVDNLQ